VSLLRVKGQENRINLVSPRGVEVSINAIRSFEVTYKIVTKEEGYLGQVANQFDDIYNGLNGKVEFDYSDPNYFVIQEAIVARAQRRSVADANAVFNFISTLTFPTGIVVTRLFPDIFFGDIGETSGSREDYLQGAIDWSCTGPAQRLT
jgi:hypothetical protein